MKHQAMNGILLRALLRDLKIEALEPEHNVSNDGTFSHIKLTTVYLHMHPMNMPGLVIILVHMQYFDLVSKEISFTQQSLTGSKKKTRL
ncbi:hypothetical protein XENTR_v10014194 [Xenopus tropicalis]|nr:hypothetical protein XENTR_v10014194 [Xenopus tropicalis]